LVNPLAMAAADDEEANASTDVYEIYMTFSIEKETIEVVPAEFSKGNTSAPDYLVVFCKTRLLLTRFCRICIQHS
jgi:hypothetical protein